MRAQVHDQDSQGPNHGHDHRHAHNHGHSHNHGFDQEGVASGFLSIALLATAALVAAEFVGGYFGHSVALFSDAIHNLSDMPGIVIAWVAARWSLRGADAERTFGYRRAGILAAFTNAILLILVAFGLLVEAYGRFRHPEPVAPGLMIALSLVALVLNGGITLGLVRGRSDLNMRALLFHNAGDALSDLAILAGAFVIRYTGAVWIDPLLGALIGALVLGSSLGILRESGNILLEGSPQHMRPAEVALEILGVPGVQEVHDVHVWTLGHNQYALSCHVRIPDMHMEESEKILQQICATLDTKFGIHHATVQFERAGLPTTGVYMPEPFRSGQR